MGSDPELGSQPGLYARLLYSKHVPCSIMMTLADNSESNCNSFAIERVGEAHCYRATQ